MRVAVIGAGLSGLATAYLLKQEKPDWSLSIFEKENEVGGKVRSETQDGFTFDWGPNGFLTNVSETLDLAKALGLDDLLQAASDNAKYRFIYKEGALRPLPASPPAFLKTNLLSPYGKLRAFLELIQGRAVAREESVYDFIARHFGPQVAEVFAGIAVLGITAGDAKELSVNALFPRFKELEAEHGSLIKGMMAAQKQAKATGRSSRLTSFKAGGLQTLITALSDALEEQLNKGAAIHKVTPEDEGFKLELSSGDFQQFDQVVLATPAFVSSKLVASFLPGAAERLRNIPYADVVVFGLGFDRVDVPQIMDAFGFLVARAEGVRSLGVLYSSSLFPDQASEGKVMLRVICGGTLDPDFINLSKEEAISVVRRDLEITMGITVEPEFMTYVRWPKGIPQYLLGHAENVQQIMRGVAQHRGLHVVGNAFYGVGVNDCVRDAKRVVNELKKSLTS